MLLQMLVQAWPAAAHIADEEGFLPLHHCCWSEDVLFLDIQLLVEAWPDALQVATIQRGMLPLHLACAYKERLPMEVILYLIDSYPLAAKVQDKHGQFPLHIACSKALNDAVVERLIQLWPDAVSVPCDYIDPPAPFVSLMNFDDDSTVAMGS